MSSFDKSEAEAVVRQSGRAQNAQALRMPRQAQCVVRAVRELYPQPAGWVAGCKVGGGRGWGVCGGGGLSRAARPCDVQARGAHGAAEVLAGSDDCRFDKT